VSVLSFGMMFTEAPILKSENAETVPANKSGEIIPSVVPIPLG